MSAAAVTVGVATCGRPAGLSRCLQALAAQTEPAAEVIVVDQAPSTSARDALDASGLEGGRYLEQPRLGLSASRNLALRSTGTAYLAVTDDDCVPDPGWIEALAHGLEASPEPAAVTGRILPFGDAPPGAFAISLRDAADPADHRGRIIPWSVGSGANFAGRVDALRSAAGWDERLGVGSSGMAAEDTDLLDRLLAGGEIVRYRPDAVVRHEWQTRERRLATRWSYGYGIGAMCGLRLATGDRFALEMLVAYARLHARPLLRSLSRRDRFATRERSRALASVIPGVLYGLRVEGSNPSGLTER